MISIYMILINKIEHCSNQNYDMLNFINFTLHILTYLQIKIIL